MILTSNTEALLTWAPMHSR